MPAKIVFDIFVDMLAPVTEEEAAHDRVILAAYGAYYFVTICPYDVGRDPTTP